MFESLLNDWDGENVVFHHDPPTGAWIIIAAHSSRLGPSAGGTRMKPYPNLEAALKDVLRLSRGMTYKFAVPGIPLGGGKAVIKIPEDLNPDARPGLLRRYGSLLQQLGGLYHTAADVGTSSADMDIIAETGAPYVFGRTPEAGGAGSSGPFTGLGVFAGIQVACQHLYGEASTKGRRVLVQGVGSVGGNLIEHLLEDGAEVSFSEVDEGLITRYRDEMGLAYVPPEDLFAADCDILSPCALGGVLNRETIPQLRCKAVVGGANNQLAAPEDMARLQERGILYAPDYVVNVGGAMGVSYVEVLNKSRAEAEREVDERVREALGRVFGMSKEEGITTEAAARRIAEERLGEERKKLDSM